MTYADEEPLNTAIDIHYHIDEIDPTNFNVWGNGVHNPAPGGRDVVAHVTATLEAAGALAAPIVVHRVTRQDFDAGVVAHGSTTVLKAMNTVAHEGPCETFSDCPQIEDIFDELAAAWETIIELVGQETYEVWQTFMKDGLLPTDAIHAAQSATGTTPRPT